MLKLNKIIQTSILVFGISVPTIAQQNVEVDFSNKHQTIQGFGASDAWNMDPVGKYWDQDVKEDIAELLFSTSISGSNPKGIGLSRWRFNIGGGSAEQGSSSNIDKEERRSECFIESVSGDVANYNWNKQAGQQWFLKAANDYNVEQLVAFVNSPPRFYTKNGRANSSNSNRYGTTNLADGNYNKFSDFLVTVLKHFDDEGIEFSQISPINEPQYEWNSGQEGCPWKHDEVYTLVDKLNRDIVAKGLDTKILLSEAADYRYLTGVKDDSDKSDIIDDYFSPSSDYYMGNFSQMLPGIGGHSYWINGSDSNISSIRQTLRNKVDAYGDLEVYQTEYNLLNTFYDDKLTNAVFLAKIIYADLEIAGVSMWDYWTAVERERWDQKNRFHLIRLIPGGGDYASLENSGSIAVDKNLWALGNFSRFVRPGYQRLNTSGAADLSSLMGVSFVSPDQSELVTVYTNWSDQSIDVKQSLKNLPNGKYADYAEVYITDASNDLQKASNHTLSSTFSVPKKSIVTFRIPILTEETTVSFTPDPNKKYYIDAPYHNLRLSADGESVAPTTATTNTTGSDVEWKFVAKGNGYWHIQRAAGGTMPRLRTDQNEEADMQPTSSSGSWTYFEFTEGAIANTYFITLPNVSTEFKRLQIDNAKSVNMVGGDRNGTWESFTITEVNDASESCTAGTNLALNGSVVDFSSEQNSTNGVSTINDGNDGNRWSALGFPQYAILDLGEQYTIDQVNLMPYSDRAYQFLVEGSTNSATSGFSVLTDATGNTSGGSQITKTFSSQTVRYVKLTITGASGYTGSWSSVEDFEIICSGSSSNKDLASSIANNFEITAYPNPFISSLTIDASNADQIIGSIQLVDLSGKVIVREHTGNTMNNLDDISSGLYLVQILNLKGQILSVEKVVKE